MTLICFWANIFLVYMKNGVPGKSPYIVWKLEPNNQIIFFSFFWSVFQLQTKIFMARSCSSPLFVSWICRCFSIRLGLITSFYSFYYFFHIPFLSYLAYFVILDGQDHSGNKWKKTKRVKRFFSLFFFWIKRERYFWVLITPLCYYNNKKKNIYLGAYIFFTFFG